MSWNLIGKDRRFWPLFWTQFFGALNDNVFKNALIIIITYKAIVLAGLDSKLLVPLAGGVFIFPFFIFSATAGQIADRFEKSTVIRMTKVTELIFMVLASLGFYLNNFYLLMAVLFFMGAQSAFFGPLKYGIIPVLLKEEELTQANAFVTAGTFIAILLGTIIGGGVASSGDIYYLIIVAIIGFSLLGLCCSFFIEKTKSGTKEVEVQYNLIASTWKILSKSTKNKVAIKLILGISWFWFLGAAILSLLPHFCKDVLGGDGTVTTVFLAIFTIGMGLGSFFSNKLSTEGPEMGLPAISALLMSIFLFDLAFLGTMGSHHEGELLNLWQLAGRFIMWRGAFDLLIVSILGGMYIVPQMTQLQISMPRAELSRYIAANNIWNALFMVSAAVMLMVLAPWGIGTSFLVLAGLSFLASLLLYARYSVFSIRLWMKLISNIIYRVEVKGLENLPKNGPYIIAANHVSFIDWLILMGALPHPVRFVIDWTYYYAPMGPFWFDQAGLVPIATRKESEEVLVKAFEHISEVIENGDVLGIFPEGWLTRDGKMRRFQPGILKILKKDPVPVNIIAINGLWGSTFSFKGGRVLMKFPRRFRAKITLTISPPISPGEYCNQKAQDFIRQHVDHYEDPKEKFRPKERSDETKSNTH